MHRRPDLAGGLGAALLLAGMLACPARAAAAAPRPERGLASYYGGEFDSLRTASGERFDMRAMTAAHPALPFGTRVRITNLANRRSVVVRINDRGPFVKGRIVDLSYAAARELRMVGTGVASVEVERLRRLPAPPGTRRLWRRRSVARWGPLAARIDATRVRSGA